MAPEPAHLVNVTKHCPRCNWTRVKFMYFNNGRPDQPRYKCHGCTRLFTHGGKCRQPRVSRRLLQARTMTTSTAVVGVGAATVAAAGHDGRTSAGPAAAPPLDRPRRSQRVIGTSHGQSSGAQDASETQEPGPQSGCSRTRPRTEAAADVTTGALGLPRALIPTPGFREIAVESRVVSPAVRVAVPAGHISGVVQTRDEVIDELPTVIEQCGDAATETSKWTKAILGVAPYGLVPARNGEKRVKVLKIKCGGQVSVVAQFWA